MVGKLAHGLTPAKTDILARYAGFYRGLRKSPSHKVAVIANLVGGDIVSTTGMNLRYLKECAELDP